MCRVLIATVAAATLQAATVRGIVVDHQTGRPLARATVIAQPIAGTAGAAQSAATGLDGAFSLPGLSAGAWLVTAARRGFAPAQYGRGPIRLDAAADASVSIRLHRFGAISGTVVDENDVGLQEQEVLAYRNIRPLVIAARARTDDRGVYRIDGLPPGSYFVRSAARDSDEGSFLPTFANRAAFLQDTRPVDVQYDRETAGVDVRAFPGSLVTFTGRVYGDRSAIVTLTSDTGVLTTAAGPDGRFQFPPVAPATYELSANSRDLAAWQPVEIYRGSAAPRVTLEPHPDLRVVVEDTAGRAIDPASVPILIRRRDLAGEGKTELFRAPARVMPGRYELALAPTAAWYAASISGAPSRAEGWTEVVVTGPAVEVKVVLSNRPAALRGTVRDAAGEPVPGVPVYLGGLRAVRTDTQGRYEFYGLPPGAYRVLASFDADTPVEANSRAVKLEEGQDQPLDLVLYVVQ